MNCLSEVSFFLRFFFFFFCPLSAGILGGLWVHNLLFSESLSFKMKGDGKEYAERHDIATNWSGVIATL